MGLNVTKVRWINARKLVDQHGGVCRLGEKLGMSKQQASHVFGARPIKGIGHHMARKIETHFGFEEGWMDTDHELIRRIRHEAAEPAHVDGVLARLGYRPTPLVYETIKKCAEAGIGERTLTTISSLLMAHEVTHG